MPGRDEPPTLSPLKTTRPCIPKLRFQELFQWVHEQATQLTDAGTRFRHSDLSPTFLSSLFNSQATKDPLFFYIAITSINLELNWLRAMTVLSVKKAKPHEMQNVRVCTQQKRPFLHSSDTTKNKEEISVRHLKLKRR